MARSVRVLHPGFVSVEGGPDFRGAVIQIGDAAPCSGDVEIDLRAAAGAPTGTTAIRRFKNVLLHVVWEAEFRSACAGKCRKEVRPRPLPLSHSLDAPWPNSACGWKMIRPASCPKNCAANVAWPCANWMNRCRAGFWTRPPASVFRPRRTIPRPRPARRLGASTVGRLVPRARLQTQRLADAKSRRIAPALDARRDPAFALQARLLGISGLLPAELPRVQAGRDGDLRRIWDCWWRERDEFSDCVMPRASGNFTDCVRPIIRNAGWH